MEQLTEQEMNVLRLIILGQPDQGVAYLLDIPIADATQYRLRIQRKLGVARFLQALRQSMSRQGARAQSPAVPALS